MEQYPKNLFQAMATNLLSRMRGGRTLATILKEAMLCDDDLRKHANEQPLFSTVNPATPEEVQQMMNFLASNNYRPEQFMSDTNAKNLVRQKSDATTKRINDLFEEQAKAGMGLTPDLAKNRDDMLKQVKNTYRPAVMGEGIRNAMHVQQANPERFQELQNLSARAEKALDQQSAPFWSGLAGTVSGGLMGSTFGNNTARRLGFGLPSAALGGVLGTLAGRHMAESKTGYRYGDVLGPVQLAQRVNKQVSSDPRT